MHDLLIRNARIVDGTGAPARTGNLAVDGGRILPKGDAENGGSGIVADAGQRQQFAARGG